MPEQNEASRTGLFAGRTVGGGISIPSGVATPVPLASANALYDPLGLLQSDSYVSVPQNITFTSQSWFRLPPGLWLANYFSQWAPNVIGQRALYLDFADNRMDTPGWDDFIGTPYYGYGTALALGFLSAASMSTSIGGQQQYTSSSLFPVTDVMCADGLDTAIGLYSSQTSGGALQLQSGLVYLTRIGAY